MEQTTSKKKIMLAAILTSGLALAISQSALAQPDQANVQGKQEVTAGKDVTKGWYRMDPAKQKAHEKFLNETVTIRKELAEKHAVMRALMKADTPDTTKVGQLAGELFELREKLRLKAQESGLPFPMMMGNDMPCQDMGMGMGGHGRGRHMNMMQP